MTDWRSTTSTTKPSMVCAMPITYAGLAGIAELTGQEWPTALAELLAQMHVAVQTAKQGGATALPARRLATFVKNYDALIAEGNTLARHHHRPANAADRHGVRPDHCSPDSTPTAPTSCDSRPTSVSHSTTTRPNVT